MTTSLLIFEQTSKIDGLEGHIEDLLRQKDLLEGIEYYTDNAIDFGDVLETYSLLVEEIERLQKELRERKQGFSGERGEIGEGVNALS
jgi:hypothetical protein